MWADIVKRPEKRRKFRRFEQTERRPHGKPRSRSSPALIVTNSSKNQRIQTEEQFNSTYKVVEGSRNGFSIARECIVSRMILQDGILEG